MERDTGKLPLCQTHQEIIWKLKLYMNKWIYEKTALKKIKVGLFNLKIKAGSLKNIW